LEREHKREEIKGKSEWNRMKRKSERRQWHTNCPKTTRKMKADERFVEQEYKTKNIVSFKCISAQAQCMSASKQRTYMHLKKKKKKYP